MSKLVITGATPRPPAGHPSPPRLEIATFVRDIKQFSLYIQALQAIYSRPRTDRASYFQISGIHGLPHDDWDSSPSNGRAFCAHGTVIFPTWHRPYVALFEQEVQRIAKQVASTYQSDRTAWERAAADLRQPFWGWDQLTTVVPPAQVISMSTVEIITPNGRRSNVPNPFLTYRFPPGTTPGFPPPFNRWEGTARHPDANGNTNVAALRSALNAEAHQLVENTRRLYSITNWNDFVFGSLSTTGLESIHGTVHVRTGGPGPGHMSVVPVAGFDPIFYLHHAQVDRVVDIWHSIHRRWTTDRQNLTPFWNTQTTYWVSPDIIDTNQAFNYAYGSTSRGVSEMSEQATEKVFSGEVSGIPAHQPAGQNPSGAPESAFDAASDRQASPSTETPRDALVDSTILEWSARICCKQFELGGSFSVFVFLGGVPADPTQWLTDPAFAGTVDAFVNDAPDECSNCSSQADLVIRGFVHLDRTILKRSGRSSLEPRVVVPYLTRSINWGIQKADGSVVGVDRLPSLEVTVLLTRLTLPPGAEFPVEGEPQYYHDITRGRPGGYPQN